MLGQAVQFPWWTLLSAGTGTPTIRPCSAAVSGSGRASSTVGRGRPVSGLTRVTTSFGVSTAAIPLP